MIKWIVLIYILLFESYFAYKNFTVEKHVGMPSSAKDRDVLLTALFSGFFYLIVLLSLFAPSIYENFFAPLNFLKIPIAGLILLIIATLIGIKAAQTLGDSWRGEKTENQNNTLIQAGVYKISRNPYVLSYFLIFIALFLISPSIMLFLLIFINFGLFHKMVLREEVYLKNTYKEKYIDYCDKVNRYL